MYCFLVHKGMHALLRYSLYRGAYKSLARPGRKQANVSVRMVCISLGTLPCWKRNLMTALVSILLKSCMSDILLSLFPSWSGYGVISTAVHNLALQC